MPNELPIPRAPRIVQPRSLAPTDILAAIVQTQKNAYEDLIVRPLQALGLRPPELVPTPEMMLQTMVRGQGEARIPSKRGEIEVTETPVRVEKPARGVATRGTL